MKTVTPWKTRMQKEEDSVSIGNPFSKTASRAQDITNTKIYCDMFRKLLVVSAGPLIVLNYMSSLSERKILLLALMEFHMVYTSVLLTSFNWKEVLFPNTLLKVEQSLTLNLLTSMIMEELSDLQTHFDHKHCAIAIANFSPLPFVEAFTGTLWGAFMPHNDADDGQHFF